MDMNNSLIVGAGALLVGIIIGYSMGGSGDEAAEEAMQRTEALSAQVEEMAGKVDGLDQKLGGMETAFADIGAKQDEVASALGSRIDGIGETVSGAVASLGTGVGDAVKSGIEGLRSDLAALGDAGASGGGEAPEGGAAAAEATSEGAAPESAEGGAASSEEAAASGGETAGTALRPGMTAVIDSEKLRVFLSAANAEAGSATVAVNGQSLSTIEVGAEQEVDGCRYSLTGFDADGAAMIDGGC